MAVIRISPKVNLGQILVRQMNMENNTDYQYIYSGICPTASNPGIRYNRVTETWQFSHNGTDYLDFGTGGGSGSSMPTYIIIQGISLSGDIHLQDGTNWGTNKSLIKTVIIDTVSTDWNLYILQNDNGLSVNDANVSAMQLMASGNGDEVIQRDFPYEDEDITKEVHLYFVGNSGSNTVDITIIGYALQ